MNNMFHYTNGLLQGVRGRTPDDYSRQRTSGLTPLEYMLTTMRDETKLLALRLDMAKAAAPYVHPRLSAVEQAVNVDLQEPSSITVSFVGPDGSRVKSLPSYRMMG